MAGARVNQHVCIIRTKPSILSPFLYYYLASPKMQDYINSENYGVTRQALTKQMIDNFEIPLPNIKEQKEIINRVKVLFKQIYKVEKQHELLKKKIDELPQLILAQAYSGKLVQQNPKDEPVEKLLERIKEEKTKLLEQQKELKKNRFIKRAKKEVKMKDYIESNIVVALQKNSKINIMDSFTFDDICKAINEDYEYLKNNLFEELDKSKKDGLKIYYDRLERKIKFRLGDK
jgi:hypothetical protein